MSYHGKLSSILHRQKVLADIKAATAVPSRTSISNSTESTTPSDNPATAAKSRSRSPNRISKGKGYQTSTKKEDTVISRRVKSAPATQAKIQPATQSSSTARSPRTLSKKSTYSKLAKLSETMLQPSPKTLNSDMIVKKVEKREKSCSPSPILPTLHKLPPSCLKAGRKGTLSEKHEKPSGYASNYLAQKAAIANTAGPSKVLKSALKSHPAVSSESKSTKQVGSSNLADESFDLLKVLARPETWMEENESKSSMIIDNRMLYEVEQANRMANFKGKSPNRGIMRPKTTPAARRPESKTPSLTSLISYDIRGKQEMGKKGGIITIDENNNVLESIRSTIARSLNLFDLTSSSEKEEDDKNNNTSTSASPPLTGQGDAEDNEEDVDESSLYTGNDLSEINSILTDQISSSTSNHSNAAPPAASATYGVFIRNQDSVLIPLEIEEQLEKALKLKKISHHDNLQLINHFSSKSSLKKSLSFITGIHMIHKEGERRGPDSSAHQLAYNDSVTSTSVFNRSESFTSCSVSNVPSFMTALSDERREEADEKVIEEELRESRCLDVNANLDNADKDNKQRHASRSRVVFHEQTSDDTDTGDKSNEKQTEKLKGFVVSVNSGVGISAKTTASNVATERLETGLSISAASIPSFHCHHQLHPDDTTLHSCRFPEYQGENKPFPPTWESIGADSGFPSDTTLTNFLEDLVDMRWSSPFSSRAYPSEQLLYTGSDNTVGTCNNSQVYSDVWNPAQRGEESGIIASAYDILTAGLKYASKLIGDETELEPQEDFVRYSGYKIKVQGKELLLESVHVNRDIQINLKNGTYSRSIHSFIALQPHTLSREVLEQRSNSEQEKRIRIVIRIMGSSQAGPIAPAEVEHFVQLSDGKWSLFLKENPAEKNYQKNFVEIGCPIGVYPGMIRYGLVNGLLYIDAP